MKDPKSSGKNRSPTRQSKLSPKEIRERLIAAARGERTPVTQREVDGKKDRILRQITDDVRREKLQ